MSTSTPVSPEDVHEIDADPVNLQRQQRANHEGCRFPTLIPTWPTVELAKVFPFLYSPLMGNPH